MFREIFSEPLFATSLKSLDLKHVDLFNGFFLFTVICDILPTALLASYIPVALCSTLSRL